jgi:hypothetical protein
MEVKLVAHALRTVPRPRQTRSAVRDAPPALIW